DNDEFKLVKTDAELFDQISGTVVPRYFWRNKKEFVQQGAGFSLMLEDEPVSTAFSAFAFETELELGIETQSLYQGKGLAQLVCSALIDFCLENNLEPVWACRLENTGSFQLAQKLGFEPVRMIPYYQLPI
ncbi:MAG: GNAT family N-acetyltransferase, partial [Bacteroidota bacterium]|nr:GNAT family N-acetyltransferase [Bacteroidota bacterium]